MVLTAIDGDLGVDAAEREPGLKQRAFHPETLDVLVEPVEGLQMFGDRQRRARKHETPVVRGEHDAAPIRALPRRPPCPAQTEEVGGELFDRRAGGDAATATARAADHAGQSCAHVIDEDDEQH